MVGAGGEGGQRTGGRLSFKAESPFDRISWNLRFRVCRLSLTSGAIADLRIEDRAWRSAAPEGTMPESDQGEPGMIAGNTGKPQGLLIGPAVQGGPRGKSKLHSLRPGNLGSLYRG